MVAHGNWRLMSPKLQPGSAPLWLERCHRVERRPVLLLNGPKSPTEALNISKQIPLLNSPKLHLKTAKDS